VLLLVHGLGGTGDVWRDVELHWRGRWLAPDLPGHGGSDPLPRYTFSSMAAELSPLIGPTDTVYVLGHSLGGVLGLQLAGVDARIRTVVGLGIKVAWTDDELDRAAALAQRPVAWFDSRAEAEERHRRVSGVGDRVPQEVAAAGVREENGRWRLALDPAVFGVGAPDMPALLAGCPVPATLARGEHDPMVSHAQLAALVPEPVTLLGLGHNAHVEDPGAVYALL
jgi:pimeloyl-ACP methyl ester carboxylesterase